jgi:hypothetical protein
MPILVVCQGCKASFQVSEKFAGKKGPCPKCKAVITIPAVQEDIVIHAPESAGPKDSTGRPVFKPILREETKLSSTAIFAMVAAVVTVLLVTVVLRFSAGGPPPLILALGAVLLAPPLGVAGYAMLRDQEITPYRGKTLWIRVAASSLVYALLWAAFLWLPPLVMGIDAPTEGTYSTYNLLLIVPVVVAVGSLTAYAAYDLEFGQAAMHYGLYLAVTVILSWLAGVSWVPAATAM